MADDKEVGASPEVNETTFTAENQEFTLPNGFIYKKRKLGPVTIPWYASPSIQLGMVAFVCFLCPGMFNALGGLGGGGQNDPHTADKMVRHQYPHPIYSRVKYERQEERRGGEGRKSRNKEQHKVVGGTKKKKKKKTLRGKEYKERLD